LTIGVVNPTDTDAIDEVALLSGLHVQIVMTTLANLFDSIQQVYGHKKVDAPRGPGEPRADGASAGDSVSDIVNGLFHEGLARRASDIHVESYLKACKVRFRVDGMLVDGSVYAKELEAALLARIKILAKLDITETRLPQDGHIRFVYG